MKLTIIIVNYNVRHYLAQCLDAVYQAIDGLRIEVRVVDNASFDDSETYIKHHFPHTPYIYNKSNIGFACACNQILKEVESEYVLLLNPDTVLTEETLCKALAFMDTHPEAGAVGVRMLEADGSFLPESKRGYPTLMATWGKISGWGKYISALNGYYRNDLSEEEVGEVEVLCGAFLLMRTATLKQVGLLDEDFFMYGEDVDISCRLRAAGFRNYYLPLSILHYKGESTNHLSEVYVRTFYHAMRLFVRKHAEAYSSWQQSAACITISMLTYLKLMSLWFRKPLQKLFAPLFRSADDFTSYRFLVFANENSIYTLRRLFQRNGLTGKHHFVVANEHSTPDGHGVIPDIDVNNFTHVVYDCRDYSYQTILNLLLKYRESGLQLGIYHPANHLLITSEHCFE